MKLKALDHRQRLLKTLLVHMLHSDVSKLTLCRYVMCSNFALLHPLTDVKETLSNVLCTRSKCTVADYVQCHRVSMCSGTCSNSLPNPSSVSMYEQITASFMARAEATSSASIVDNVVRL